MEFPFDVLETQKQVLFYSVFKDHSSCVAPNIVSHAHTVVNKIPLSFTASGNGRPLLKTVRALFGPQ